MTRYPRTWRGWRALFWLSLGRCPIHHSRLRIDMPLYDDRRTAYCFDCSGIGLWPQGAREALRQNAMAVAARKSKETTP
jgi:hypothetical protein